MPVDVKYKVAQEARAFEEAEASLTAALGLTTSDAVRLLDIYGRGEHAPDHGELAFQRLTTPTQPE